MIADLGGIKADRSDEPLGVRRPDGRNQAPTAPGSTDHSVVLSIRVAQSCLKGLHPLPVDVHLHRAAPAVSPGRPDVPCRTRCPDREDVGKQEAKGSFPSMCTRPVSSGCISATNDPVPRAWSRWSGIRAGRTDALAPAQPCGKLVAALVVQGSHVIEHTVRVVQYVSTGLHPADLATLWIDPCVVPLRHQPGLPRRHGRGLSGAAHPARFADRLPA